jgi:hypothetical protein
MTFESGYTIIEGNKKQDLYVCIVATFLTANLNISNNNTTGCSKILMQHFVLFTVMDDCEKINGL